MSDDVTRTPGPTRPSEAFMIGELGEAQPRRFENPLARGLLVLLMVAVATTVLVATDEDDGSVVAGQALASEPLSPEPSEPEPTTASSVQEVASETARPEVTESWADGQSAIEYGAQAEGLRHQVMQDQATSTTVAPTTTEAPTTTVPPTTASTTAAAAAAETTDTTVAADDGTETTEAAGDGTETTETTAGDTTETTVADESTTTAPSTTAAPETTTTAAAGDGWVDTGNGVLVPPVLLAIRWCESRDDYQAANTSSSARGAYQFIRGSWDAYGHADRYGVSEAHHATNAQQDEAALLTWERDGTRPWNASRTCWSSRI